MRVRIGPTQDQSISDSVTLTPKRPSRNPAHALNRTQTRPFTRLQIQINSHKYLLANEYQIRVYF